MNWANHYATGTTGPPMTSTSGRRAVAVVAVAVAVVVVAAAVRAWVKLRWR